MKKTAALFALAALATATPAAAQGYLGLEYGNDSVEVFGSETDLDVWQGEGAVGFGGAGWGGQVGASFGNISVDSDDADFWTLNGHLSWSGGGWRIGGVVATTNLDFGGGSEADEIAYGVEGMFAPSANSNIYASYTIGDADDGLFGSVDLSNFDVGGNYYFSPNARIGGTFGVGNIEAGGGDVDSLSLGINGEFQPWSAPVSITLGWNTYEIDDADLSADTFQIGARWNFGGGTLQDRDGKLPFNTYTGFANRVYGIY